MCFKGTLRGAVAIAFPRDSDEKKRDERDRYDERGRDEEDTDVEEDTGSRPQALAASLQC